MAVNERAARALRYLIAQGATDKALRRELGVTKRAIAERVGISPRSLDRYLSGERTPPDDVNLRMLVAAQDLASDAREVFKREAKSKGVPFHTVDGVPVRSSRYERPKRLVRGTVQEPSSIITVDVKGLDGGEVYETLRVWWDDLAQRGGDWNVRLLVNVSVADYFGPQGPANTDVRKTVGGRSFVPMWVPPAPFLFVSRGRTRIRYPNADAALEALADVLLTNYAGRIPENYGFHKLAFIPIKGRDDSSRRVQKRRGKR